MRHAAQVAGRFFGNANPPRQDTDTPAARSGGSVDHQAIRPVVERESALVAEIVEVLREDRSREGSRERLRAIVNKLAPGVGRVDREALAETFPDGELPGVVGRRTEVADVIEARKRKCSLKVNAREKVEYRCW
ncbi:MAG: hypothetical protein ACREA2_07030 [Blastocatellia bacterium]